MTTPPTFAGARADGPSPADAIAAATDPRAIRDVLANVGMTPRDTVAAHAVAARATVWSADLLLDVVDADGSAADTLLARDDFAAAGPGATTIMQAISEWWHRFPAEVPDPRVLLFYVRPAAALLRLAARRRLPVPADAITAHCVRCRRLVRVATPTTVRRAHDAALTAALAPDDPAPATLAAVATSLRAPGIDPDGTYAAHFVTDPRVPLDLARAALTHSRPRAITVALAQRADARRDPAIAAVLGRSRHAGVRAALVLEGEDAGFAARLTPYLRPRRDARLAVALAALEQATPAQWASLTPRLLAPLLTASDPTLRRRAQALLHRAGS